MKNLRSSIQGLLARSGYQLQKIADPELEAGFLALHREIRPYTMTSVERQHALYDAVRHIERADIPGDFVECGVWKGGSSMLMTRTLQQEGSTARSLYLYDTYAGMSEPTEKDINVRGVPALGAWRARQKENRNEWDYASLEEVRKNLMSTGYPQERMIFVEGKVEDTIPKTLPEHIALLRLDTDWYESTYHELVHLYPRLVSGGVLILDDYGHWKGAREAVDRYFAEQNIPMLLSRIDYSGRIGVKP